MRRATFGILLSCIFGSVVVVSSAQEEEFSEKPRKVVKSDQEWARKLTRSQFLVTRMKATEPAFSGKLLNNHAKGIYACVCCDSELFTSQTKFNSGTGWPSFWQPYSAKNVATEMDYAGGEPRVEVTCSTCGAHLGHVFSDGPRPTGLRFCINSLALKFVKPKPAAPSKSTKKEDAEATKEESADGQDAEATPEKKPEAGSSSESKAKEKTKGKASSK